MRDMVKIVDSFRRKQQGPTLYYHTGADNLIVINVSFSLFGHAQGKELLLFDGEP